MKAQDYPFFHRVVSIEKEDHGLFQAFTDPPQKPRRVGTHVSLIDLYPTLVELAGVSRASPGRSLVAARRGVAR